MNILKCKSNFEFYLLFNDIKLDNGVLTISFNNTVYYDAFVLLCIYSNTPFYTNENIVSVYSNYNLKTDKDILILQIKNTNYSDKIIKDYNVHKAISDIFNIKNDINIVLNINKNSDIRYAFFDNIENVVNKEFNANIRLLLNHIELYGIIIDDYGLLRYVSDISEISRSLGGVEKMKMFNSQLMACSDIKNVIDKLMN